MKAIFPLFEFGGNLKTQTLLISKESKMVNTVNIVFCFGPKLGLKTKVLAQAEQYDLFNSIEVKQNPASAELGLVHPLLVLNGSRFYILNSRSQ